MAASPELIWWLFAVVGGLALAIGALLSLRPKQVGALQGRLAGVGEGGSSFAHDEIFDDRSGRERYIRFNMFLTGAGVITWLPGLLIVGVWIFAWVVLINYGYLLYLLFGLLIALLTLIRPIDALESFLVSGRYLKAFPKGLSGEDKFLLTQVTERMSRARWFYSLLGVWFAFYVVFDYLFGAGLAGWLALEAGLGPSFGPEQWRFTIFVAVLVGSYAASLAAWRPGDLLLEPPR